MTLPFDSTKPERRPIAVTFFTDEDTSAWLNGHDTETGLGLSLICHRIVKGAKEAEEQSKATAGEEKRTGEDRRKSACV